MNEPARKYTSRGTVAVLLAAGVALSVVILTSAAAWALVDRNNVVPEHISSLLTTGLGALIGALSVYLGATTSTTRQQPPPGEQDLTGDYPGEHASDDRNAP